MNVTEKEARRLETIKVRLLGSLRLCKFYTQKCVGGFFYKTFVFLDGVPALLKTDTGFEAVMARSDARWIIKSQGLEHASLTEMIENWTEYGFNFEGRRLTRDFERRCLAQMLTEVT